MGHWPVENMPRETSLELPDRHSESHREIPFADWDDADWGDVMTDFLLDTNVVSEIMRRRLSLESSPF